jgi:hypothetical protein
MGRAFSPLDFVGTTTLGVAQGWDGSGPLALRRRAGPGVGECHRNPALRMPLQSQRDCGSMPGVGASRLPRVHWFTHFPNPNGDCVMPPHVDGHNPVEVDDFRGRFPRVDRPSQPRALVRYPDGVMDSKAFVFHSHPTRRTPRMRVPACRIAGQTESALPAAALWA